jgi:hypothetical protein
MSREPSLPGSDFWRRLGLRLSKRRVLVVVYVLLALAVSFQQYYGPRKHLWGGTYTHYNNFQTFRHSFPNLVAGRDLHAPHPEQHGDLFKYSPAFALFMAPFWYLPPLPGLILWNLVNALAIFAAVRLLPLPGDRLKALILWFILIELITSLQNSQSNGLMAGLLLAGFALLELRRTALATLALSLSVFIKLFGLPAFLIVLCYSGQRKRAVGYSVMWFALLAVIPLSVTSWEHLVNTYETWYAVLAADTHGPGHLSVGGWMYSWFGLEIPKSLLLVVGAVLLTAPLWRRDSFGAYPFRLLYYASILAWVIIFNHKAESSTYVIALTGIAIWYFTQTPVRIRTVLFVGAFVLASLSPTFLFPAFLRSALVYPLKLKAVSCIAAYARMVVELVGKRYRPRPDVAAVVTRASG